VNGEWPLDQIIHILKFKGLEQVSYVPLTDSLIRISHPVFGRGEGTEGETMISAGLKPPPIQKLVRNPS
jgi:hypothetical protein